VWVDEGCAVCPEVRRRKKYFKNIEKFLTKYKNNGIK
jgi:hypothetical protein